MSKFFDNLCRVLGSPMPRRKAFRYILGGLAGGGMLHILPSRASAATAVEWTDPNTGKTWTQPVPAGMCGQINWGYQYEIDTCSSLGGGYRAPTLAETQTAVADGLLNQSVLCPGIGPFSPLWMGGNGVAKKGSDFYGTVYDPRTGDYVSATVQPIQRDSRNFAYNLKKTSATHWTDGVLCVKG